MTKLFSAPLHCLKVGFDNLNNQIIIYRELTFPMKQTGTGYRWVRETERKRARKGGRKKLTYTHANKFCNISV